MVDDDDVWFDCHNKDTWIFDKLILSRKLGYTCGPIDAWVPKPDYYIVRPCVNLAGMGRGATIEYIKRDTDHLPVGYFWCEIFKGRHLSVDYSDGRQKLITEGLRIKENPLWKFDKWIRVNDEVEYPSILNELNGDYPIINCEFIGRNLIEVHLRANYDMGNYNEIIPVWKGEECSIMEGYTYVEHKDFNRLGFWKK